MEKACYGRSVWKATTGGSYFNKYLMGEDGCIGACVGVCVCVQWWGFGYSYVWL